MRYRALEKIRSMNKKRSFFTRADAVKHGIHWEELRRMVGKGLIESSGRGVYRFPEAEIACEDSYALAAITVPRGVICLASALRFHGITTQLPANVWMAIENKMWRPKQAGIRLELVFLSGAAFNSGVEVHKVNGIEVRVYSPAKTVVDCFKFRNKIGLEVALEALKEGRRSRRFTADELVKYARIDRVLNVMKPYMEAVF
jgi:predicted transcriptional regulator of viral defense system